LENIVTSFQSAAGPRVAIASVGLGRIQRGYERYFNGIFSALRDDFDIVLYKSAGPERPGEKVPSLFGPVMTACRILPLGVIPGAAEYKSYKHDCLAFGLTLLPQLVRDRFNVVHVIDYPLAIALLKLRRAFGYRGQVIFCDGGLMPPQYYPRADYVQVTAEVHFQEALAWGIPSSRVTMIPCGFSAQQFAFAADRRQLRRKYGISDNTFVILSVAAINRGHKRVDHIVEEVSRLKGDVLLWMDGRLDDPSLAEMARQKLGERCRITHVPSRDVAELYHLADVFVHAALDEGFGLVVCEAAAAGLMVLVHDSPHFRWLVGDSDCLVDMNAPGQLSRRLQELAACRPQDLNRPARQLGTSMRDRFDWEVLAPAYKEMYRKVAAFQASSNGGSR
jgi:1,2-diacylglycerol 3-alpha-glucosyltransferase